MKPYLRVTLWYLVFGLGWIFFSDRLLAAWARDTAFLSAVQTFKGAVFVGLSSILLFLLTRKAFRDQAAKEAEKQAVFRETVAGAYHILLNYLNQMQLVTLAAEDCKEFDQETLALAKRASEQATAELMKLQQIESVNVGQVDAAIYGRPAATSAAPKDDPGADKRPTRT